MAILCNAHFRIKRVDIWLFDPGKRLGYGRWTSVSNLASTSRTRVMATSNFSLTKRFFLNSYLFIIFLYLVVPFKPSWFAEFESPTPSVSELPICVNSVRDLLAPSIRPIPEILNFFYLFIRFELPAGASGLDNYDVIEVLSKVKLVSIDGTTTYVCRYVRLCVSSCF